MNKGLLGDIKYIPLHLHTEYSLLQSVLRIDQALDRAVKDNGYALAITDTNALFGAADFFLKARAKDIKPIIGMEINVCANSMALKQGNKPNAHGIVLLASNQIGYKHLCLLSSRAFRDGFFYVPRIDIDLLTKYSDGLFCLSGNIFGFIDNLLVGQGESIAEEYLLKFLDIFGAKFFLELQRNIYFEIESEASELVNISTAKAYAQQQKDLNLFFEKMSQKHCIPLVATNNIHYLDASDYTFYKMVHNINKLQHKHIRRPQYNSKELFYKTTQEMLDLFPDHVDAILNTYYIAEACDLVFDTKTNYYPSFLVKDNVCMDGVIQGRTEQEVYLKEVCENAICTRYDKSIKEKIQKKYPGENVDLLITNRLANEMKEIVCRGFTDYILIVYDFISWARKQGISIGPGRGSGGGSIILFLLGVVDTEPLHLELFFERFINPERPSFPDIDIDICMRRRHEVVNYLVNTYGYEHVSHIGTYGHMKAKMALRDVARVSNVSIGQVESLIKAMPTGLNISIQESLDSSIEFRKIYDSSIQMKHLVDSASKLEGLIRNWSMHAAGIIVSSVALEECMPLATAKNTEIAVSQYSMKFIDALGFLKIDLLGLKTLSAIQDVEQSLINQGKSIPNVLHDVSDEKTYEMLRSKHTIGIFQLESAGMSELLNKLRVDKFEELIAAIALFRPGPKISIPSFIRRKHGDEAIEYFFPELEVVLKETYGIIVYQEQVMKISQIIADYTLGEGDILRRAMGKKQVDIMEEQRAIFCSRAISKGFEAGQVQTLFEIISMFAGYGFNKSHAAAYAYLSYKTAFLKAHYPGLWLASLMNVHIHDMEKIKIFIQEAKNIGLRVFCPDVNVSNTIFIEHNTSILVPIHLIKSIGQGVSKSIVDERLSGGVFKSIEDFILRMLPYNISEKLVVCLIKGGALDKICKSTRRCMINFVEAHYKHLIHIYLDQKRGILDMFSMKDIKMDESPDSMDMQLERLYDEESVLGMYLSDHPISLANRMSQKKYITISQFLNRTNLKEAIVLFLVDRIKINYSNQTKFAVIGISDENIQTTMLYCGDLESCDIESTSCNRRVFYGHVYKKQHTENQNIRLICNALLPYNQTTAKMYVSLYKKKHNYNNRVSNKNMRHDVAYKQRLKVWVKTFGLHEAWGLYMSLTHASDIHQLLISVCNQYDKQVLCINIRGVKLDVDNMKKLGLTQCIEWDWV